MPDEMNPNHPVTRAMHDQWHKILAIAMRKMGLKEICLTEADLRRAHDDPDGINLVVTGEQDGLRVTVVSDAVAARIAKANPGQSH